MSDGDPSASTQQPLLIRPSPEKSPTFRSCGACKRCRDAGYTMRLSCVSATSKRNSSRSLFTHTKGFLHIAADPRFLPTYTAKGLPRETRCPIRGCEPGLVQSLAAIRNRDHGHHQRDIQGSPAVPPFLQRHHKTRTPPSYLASLLESHIPSPFEGHISSSLESSYAKHSNRSSNTEDA